MRWIDQAKWIAAAEDFGEVCPVFRKRLLLRGPVREAFLQISARGVYEVFLNGQQAGDFFLAPGWTNYRSRIQFQEYNVTGLLSGRETELRISAGKGWYGGRLTHGTYPGPCPAVIAALAVFYQDGAEEVFRTDADWEAAESPVRFSDLYDGETYDARVIPEGWRPVSVLPEDDVFLIEQEGPAVREQAYLSPAAVLHTSRGETVLDFGQNLTGYVRFTVRGRPGDVVELSDAEILDRDGNFYNENYRSAKSRICYLCKGGVETYQPHFSFQGFRYVRLDSWPGEVRPEDFTAVAVHSDMERTGHFACSSPLLNRLYQNVLWGQRGNFLDIPTDCPQRDERMGWTGDAQVFSRAASYNFDVERFFRKWLRDLKTEQKPSGAVPRIVPNCWDPEDAAPAAWGDAAVICPWQIYWTYGNRDVLEEQFSSMRGWVDYVRSQGSEEGLWDTGDQYGDWLGLDAEEGSYRGKTDPYLIATAYFYRSTQLLCRAGEVLGKEMTVYRELAGRIQAAFRRVYVQGERLTSDTQTAYALALETGLADSGLEKAFADRLAELVRLNGNRLQTGFVGTPCLLYALADHGYPDLAVTLLLQEEYPSWLYSVRQGATTVWEHWDGLKPDGTVWSPDMNSFNHYAYGAVADFLYGRLCGIEPLEPGFRRIRIQPLMDARLDWAEASVRTRHGAVGCGWRKEKGGWFCTVQVPRGCTAEVDLPGIAQTISEGTHEFRVFPA